MAEFLPPPLGLARAVRWSVSLHFAALVLQVVAALFFLSGYAQGYELHRLNAYVVLALGIMQALAVLAFAVRGMGKVFTAMAVLIPVGEASQIYLGSHAMTGAHVTVAMAVWAFSIAMLLRVAHPDWAPKSPAVA